MAKLWLVAKHEYFKRVQKRSFLLATFGLPLLITLSMAIAGLAIGSSLHKSIGYVDQAGIMAGMLGQSGGDNDFLAYPDEVSARAALEEGTIQAYYILPADYLHSRNLELYYWDEQPGRHVMEDFDQLLRTQLSDDLPESVRYRIMKGWDLKIIAADGSRSFDERTGFVSIMMPFIASMLFFFAVMAASGYLLQAVTDEKENRTVEILATSLTPGQLMSGKAIGLLAVALTQIAAWAISIAVALVIAAQIFEPLQGFQVPWGYFGIILLFFVPSYALAAGIMISIGSIVTDIQQGQQMASVVNMLFLAPMFVSTLMLSNPDSPILVAMTLFPTTALLTISLRWSMAVVPFWQLSLSWLLLAAASAAAIWASGRLFRTGMLRYGQRLNLRNILAAIRQSTPGFDVHEMKGQPDA